jgi:hypothetical protein
MKFEVGRWYTSSKWLTKSIMKFFSQDEDSLYYTEAYINKKKENYHYESSYWSYNDEVRLATDQEIKEYLPDDHPDLINTYVDNKEDLSYLESMFKKLNII